MVWGRNSQSHFAGFAPEKEKLKKKKEEEEKRIFTRGANPGGHGRRKTFLKIPGPLGLQTDPIHLQAVEKRWGGARRTTKGQKFSENLRHPKLVVMHRRKKENFQN